MNPFPSSPTASSQVGGPDDYRKVEGREDILVYTCGAFGAGGYLRPAHRPPGGGVVGEGHGLGHQDHRRTSGRIRAAAERWHRARPVLQGRGKARSTPGAESYEIDNWATCLSSAWGTGSGSKSCRARFPSGIATCTPAGQSATKRRGSSRSRRSSTIAIAPPTS